MRLCIKYAVQNRMETRKSSWHQQAQWAPVAGDKFLTHKHKTPRKIKERSAVSHHPSEKLTSLSSWSSQTILRNIYFFNACISPLCNAVNSLRAGMHWLHHPQQTKRTAYFHTHSNCSMRIYRVINAEYQKWSWGQWAIRKVGPIFACFMALAQWLALGSP